MRGHTFHRVRRRRHTDRRTKRYANRRLSQGIEPLESRNLLAASILESEPLELDLHPIGEQADAPPFARVLNAQDVTREARIVNGQPTSAYPAVGIVNDGCTGTLIGSNVVLTAAHCMEGFSGGYIGNREGTFDVGGQTYGSSQVYIHPQADLDDNSFGTDEANDIAIMVLAQHVPGITPMEIFRGVPLVGDILTLVGYGGGGSGSGGHNGDFGELREGTTPIDQVTSTLIHWTFDNNGESNTAPGDSGGPAFLTVNGQMHIAGVTSGGDQYDAGIGDHSFDTRVDAYADWIDSIFGNTSPDPDPDPHPNPDPDPDPQPDPQPDGDDHPDVPGPDATPIPLDETGFGFVDATLETAGDQDVFQIALDEFGLVEIELFSWDGDLDTHLSLYDGDRTLIAENDDQGQWTDSALELDLPAGAYFVSAGSHEDAGMGEYGLDLYFTAADVPDPNPDPDTEPNPNPGGDDDDHADTPAADATEIWLDPDGFGLELGSLESAGDYDVFQILIEEGGVTTVLVNQLDEGLDTTLAILDTDGNPIDQNDDFAGTTDSQLSVNLDPGVYYVSVGSHDDSGVGEYVVKVVAPGVGWEDEVDWGLFDENDDSMDEFEEPWDDTEEPDDFGDPMDEAGDSWDDVEGSEQWEDPWDELDESGEHGDFWDDTGDPWDEYADVEGLGDPWDDFEEANESEGAWGEIDDDYAWDVFDVNEDAIVSPLDVLGIISYLNVSGEWRSAEASSPREDVNSDGVVSPMDVLIVINHLNDPAGGANNSPSGEGVERQARQLAAPSTNLPAPQDVAATLDSSVEDAPLQQVQDANRDTRQDGVDHAPYVSTNGNASGEYRRLHRTSHDRDVDLLMETGTDWLGELRGDPLLGQVG